MHTREKGKTRAHSNALHPLSPPSQSCRLEEVHNEAIPLAPLGSSNWIRCKPLALHGLEAARQLLKSSTCSLRKAIKAASKARKEQVGRVWFPFFERIGIGNRTVACLVRSCLNMHMQCCALSPCRRIVASHHKSSSNASWSRSSCTDNSGSCSNHNNSSSHGHSTYNLWHECSVHSSSHSNTHMLLLSGQGCNSTAMHNPNSACLIQTPHNS